jgi:predicted phosphodiesterase
MRFQLFSDLHVDVARHKSIVMAEGIDAVVVPGDVCEGAINAFRVLREIVPIEIPIALTLGNHEFYGRFHPQELEEARKAAPDFRVSLLENDCVSICGVRFAGATTWTDYRIFGDRNAPAAMAVARTGLNDHRRIGWRKKPWARFRPEEALMLHSGTRAFLKDALATDQPTVVVTHHAPSMLSVADRYLSDALTAAFASSIAHDLLEAPSEANADTGVGPRLRADVWCHGHTHNSADYVLASTSTRVIANPHGYGPENDRFDPSLVVEVRA